jgi:hypothetical protein
VAPFKAEAVILSLPAGWGKTTMAERMAAFIGCNFIVDEWHPGMPVTAGALHLTNVNLEGSAA